MKMKRITYLIVIILFAVTASPQTTVLSIDSAVSLAIANFPQLKAAQLSVEKQRALKSSVLDLGTTGIYTGKEETGNGSPGIYNKIAIEQSDINILGAGAHSKLIKAQEYQAKATLNLTRKNLIKETKSAWLDAVAAKKQFLLLQELDTVFVNFQQAAKLRYETQQCSKIEYLSATAKYKEIRMAVNSARNNYSAALQNLNYYLLLETEFDVDTNLKEVAYFEIKDSPEFSTVTNYYESNVKLAHSQWKSERSAVLPKLNLAYKRQSIENETGYHAWQVGITAPLLFFAQSAKNKAAKIDYEIAEYEYRSMKMKISTGYKTLLNRYAMLKDAVDFYVNEALPLADEQLKAAGLAYQSGNIDYMQFIQNVESAVKIKQDYIMKQTGLQKVIAEIEFFTD